MSTVERRATEIFPGLPEEIGVECLIRVPFTSHTNLRAVSRSWRNMMSNPLFYQDRKRLGKEEDLLVIVQSLPWIYDPPCCKVVIYHPSSKSYRRIPRIPTTCLYYQYGSSHCVSFGHRLIVMGLVDGDNQVKASKLGTTFVFSFCSCKWQRGTNMLVGRQFFSCAVDSINGLIYSAGGFNKDYKRVHEAEVYNIEEDRWSLLPPMIKHGGNCYSAFINGKFLVVSNDTNSECAQVYDPTRRLWTAINRDSYFPRANPCVSAFGRLYFFGDLEIRDYDFSKDEMGGVELFPPGLKNVDCATVWRNKIFVSGVSCKGTIFYLYKPSTRGQPEKWTQVKLRKPMFPFARGYFYAKDHPYHVIVVYSTI